jgi:hypothetical protein
MTVVSVLISFSVRLVLSSSKRIDEDDIDKLKQIISTRVEHTIALEAQLNLLW